MTEFEIFLMRNHIRRVLGKVTCPQTNGSVKKLFHMMRKKIKFFSPIDDCAYWYNTIRPHGALDQETPADTYYDMMPQRHTRRPSNSGEGGIVIMGYHFSRNTLLVFQK